MTKSNREENLCRAIFDMESEVRDTGGLLEAALMLLGGTRGGLSAKQRSAVCAVICSANDAAVATEAAWERVFRLREESSNGTGKA